MIDAVYTVHQTESKRRPLNIVHRTPSTKRRPSKAVVSGRLVAATNQLRKITLYRFVARAKTDQFTEFRLLTLHSQLEVACGD